MTRSSHITGKSFSVFMLKHDLHQPAQLQRLVITVLRFRYRQYSDKIVCNKHRLCNTLTECNRTLIFLFLNQNICFGNSKERLIKTVLFSTQNIYADFFCLVYLNLYVCSLLSSDINTFSDDRALIM